MDDDLGRDGCDAIARRGLRDRHAQELDVLDQSSARRREAGEDGIQVRAAELQAEFIWGLQLAEAIERQRWPPAPKVVHQLVTADAEDPCQQGLSWIVDVSFEVDSQEGFLDQVSVSGHWRGNRRAK